MSVPSFREVRLEIVRPGKPHNQLLSPLTPYMALCGEGSPITFHVDFEHHQLLQRLERLRYVTRSGQRFVPIAPRLREAEVGELGNEVARILSEIETLSTELARAQGNQTGGASDAVVHLRLVLSGSELALIPFELAIAPLAYPGEGLEFCLQASLPIVVTREIRRGRPIPFTWNQSSSTAPKVLVIYAEPDGLKVPAAAHIQKIRAALEPWIRRLPEKERTADPAENDRRRLRFVKHRLRLLPNASIESIYKMCATERFTHVHILAHGDTYEYAGEMRFGVALCRDGSPQLKEVVSGKRLAKALQAEDARGGGRSDPLAVTLATCDSGNQMTVLVPGGSIAHDLHVEGIPWVFASQFPLTVSGSVRMAEILYQRLFRGDDPRQIFFELRRQLYQSAQNDHDWASLVAYATLPGDFGSQVVEFCSSQIKEAINVCLDHADSITTPTTIADTGQEARTPEGIKSAIHKVEEWLHTWRDREPTGNSPAERLRRAEISGIHGSTYKRIALLLAKIEGESQAEERYYRESLEHYRSTMADAATMSVKFYWSATQYLSLQAIRGGERDQDTLDLARRLAERDVASSDDASTKAWAHATLAEIELLSTYHGTPADGLAERVEAHCKQVVALKGPRSFHVGSTVRQFRRYLVQWKNDRWQAIAQRAVDALVPPGVPEPEFDFPTTE
jgi:hypothetical protein